MTTTNPIVPPPELAEEWRMDYMGRAHAFIDVAIKAVQWGADQELEACCEYMQHVGFHGFATILRDARRPKPPSLKEQALKELDDWTLERHGLGGECFICDGLSVATIRRALEALDD